MDVLPRARVVQLNKMIGLQPTAAPTNQEACIFHCIYMRVMGVMTVLYIPFSDAR